MENQPTNQATATRSNLFWLSMSVVGVMLVIAFAWVTSLSSPDGRTPVPPAKAAPTSISTAADETPTLPTQHGPPWRDTDDPSRDGWDTEVFSSQALKVLDQLGALLIGSSGIQPEQLATLITEDFSCEPLVPASLQVVLSDSLLEIQRGGVREQEQDAPSTVGQKRGVSGLAQALGQLVQPFGGSQELRFKFKIFRLDPSENTVTTRQFFTLSGHTSTGVREQHATWTARWRVGSAVGDTPRLSWIGLEDFEQSLLRRPDGPLLVDCTESALGNNDCYRPQFLVGLHQRFQSLQDQRYMAVMGTIGLAVGDANADGLDDLYICQPMGLPNRFFLQQPDGTLRDVSAGWGVDWLENTRSALFVDLDQDGDQDLVAALVGNLIVASNEGERFEIRGKLSTNDDTMLLSAVDYDNDGDLDLHICVYFQNDEMEKPRAVVLGGVTTDGPAGNNGAGRNTLFRNDFSDQPWQFTDVTEEVGLATNTHHSFAAAWEDFDNDGDQDLYVANDYGANNLYRNDDGTFREITSHAAAIDDAQGMSAAWGDYDQDGLMDVYVSNMFSAAGSRITHLERFRTDSLEERRRYQRWARGNTLLRNQGDGTFDDVSGPAAVTMGRWAWGSNFVDINNDGREDLVVANGYLTTQDSGDL